MPTNHLANKKLKINDVDPSGATQSERRYRSDNVDPTVIAIEKEIAQEYRTIWIGKPSGDVMRFSVVGDI